MRSSIKKAGFYATALSAVAVVAVVGVWTLTDGSVAFAPVAHAKEEQPTSAANAAVAMPEAQPAAVASWPMLLHLDELDGPLVRGERGGTPVTLTLDVDLQRHLKQQLADGRVPRGASVLLEIPSGRIIAAAGHSELLPPGDESAFESFAEAASVFKIITASALLRAGVSENQGVCFHGGKRRMRPSQLVNDKRRDGRCTTLFNCVPLSQNVAIAKLAVEHLSREKLLEEASLLGFNQPLSTTWETQESKVTVPVDDKFELARCAAGFDGVKLSPLHAAVIAATIANGGLWVQPKLQENPAEQSLPATRVMSKENADILKQMMVATTTLGTARRRFSKRGRALKDVVVAGKTGSLTDYETKIHTSWFVGFAPADKPEVAVAVAILNDMDIWHIQAVDTARLALEAYFASKKEAGASVTK